MTLMKTLAWLTDPHLNFLDGDALDAFIEALQAEPVDGLVLTGDIAEADSVLPIMERLDQRLSYPIYFVLGNHDYYGSSVSETRRAVERWVAGSARSHWLPASGVLGLSETTALIGHSGWGDGRIGDFLESNVNLNDYRLIEDLSGLPKSELYERLKQLGDEAAVHLKQTLLQALDDYDEVIVATHVPPFLESCWYQEQTVLNEWTPHFTCEAVGQVLKQVMRDHRNKTLRVYCGHTHNGGVAQVLPNLVVYTGGAEYHRPALQEAISVR